jgi:hypothetical protein
MFALLGTFAFFDGLGFESEELLWLFDGLATRSGLTGVSRVVFVGSGRIQTN